MAYLDRAFRHLAVGGRRRRALWAYRGLALVASLVLFAATVAMAPAPAPVSAAPPAPLQKLPLTGYPALDNIYYGAEPPGSEARPVLLFVHGLGGIASDWWLRHDMYETAYNAGYRTAFVSLNLNGLRGPGNTQWVNARALTVQIYTVAQHYGVPTVDIVAHSKGGVDAQTAIVYFGAARWVRNVFTIATPHHGSEVADLPLVGWVVELLERLGLTSDEALRSVRTDAMRAYRAATDPLAAHQTVRYYTGAGTGGRANNFLSQNFGPNDGLVTVTSTRLPGAPDMGTLPLNHFQLLSGSNVFGWIRQVLEGGSGAVRAGNPNAPARATGPTPTRGGTQAP